MATSTSTASVAGVHSIDHFALEVPRLIDATTFLSAFGLDVEDQETHLLMRAAGSDHIWGKIFEGAHKRLAYPALNCFEHDLDAIRAQAVSAGGREVKPPSRFSDGEGFWVEDPDGNLLQIKPGENIAIPEGPAGDYPSDTQATWCHGSLASADRPAAAAGACRAFHAGHQARHRIL